MAVSFAALLLLVCAVIGGAALLHRPRRRANIPIDDFSVSASGILAGCPDIAEIEVLVKASRPTHRIIHIADSHYLSREEYRVLAGAPSEEGYSEYAMQVEQLQKSQVRLLCWLVDYHGLSEVFKETVREKDLAQVDANVKWYRQWRESRSDVLALASRLRREIDEAEAHGKDATVLRTREREVHRYLEWGLALGAIWDLLTARPCVRLLPTEDEQAYRAARNEAILRVHLKSLSPWQGPKSEDRDAAIVRNLLSRSTSAVIILGGGHDLSTQVKRLGGGRCEYVRVTTKGFPERVERNGRTTWVSQ